MPGGETLFGDPQRLEKAHVNAILGQLAYDENGTGPGVKRDKPWWWRAMEDAASCRRHGREDKARGAVRRGGKTVLPFTLNYSPKDVRERGNLLYEYYDAQRKGDPARRQSFAPVTSGSTSTSPTTTPPRKRRWR